MTRRLHVSAHDALDARQWPTLTARALRVASESGTAQFVCARLTGGVIALGRHQDAADALTSHALATRPIRRIGGGRTVALGEGTIAIAVAVPQRHWFADDGQTDLAASKVLNRGVRGILGGLARLGIVAGYFGRDFISVDAHQAGLLSFDIDGTGATIIECVLAAEAHWWPPEGFLSLPPPAFGRGFPEPKAIDRLAGRRAREVADALVEAHVERFGWLLDESSVALQSRHPDDEIAPFADPPALSSRSRPHELPLGHLIVGVQMNGERMEDLSITGEFLADSAGLERLRREGRGVVPSFEEMGRILNAVYSDPAHTMLGVPDLAVIAEAIVRTANVPVRSDSEASGSDSRAFGEDPEPSP